MKRPSNISWNILKRLDLKNEAQVIAELGTPKEAAHEVISRLLDEKDY